MDDMERNTQGTFGSTSDGYAEDVVDDTLGVYDTINESAAKDAAFAAREAEREAAAKELQETDEGTIVDPEDAEMRDRLMKVKLQEERLEQVRKKREYAEYNKNFAKVEANLRRRNMINAAVRYFVLIVVGIFMVYPLVWMVGATFKTNSEIFSTINPIPSSPTFQGYADAVKSSGGNINIWKAMLNTYSYVIPEVILTVISSILTAYGFGRFDFKGKGILFSIMMAMLFLPQVVLNVPQFMLFNKFGWVGSRLYLPIIVPTAFATETYFIFMLIQFLRGVPKELEEAAEIDGCNVVQRLTKIVIPMIMPAIVSCALFKFMWSSNDFLGPLLYVKSPDKYPATIFVRLSMDSDNGFNWNKVLAVSLISIMPNILIFFAAQNQFVDGISAGGVKG